MAKIIVLGAEVCGLATGMLLRRDGHEVTVLERDLSDVPPSVEEAWAQWPRDGVAQFRQPHYLHPRVRLVLEDTLPEIVTALDAAGARRFSLLGLMPPRAARAEPGLEPRPLDQVAA